MTHATYSVAAAASPKGRAFSPNAASVAAGTATSALSEDDDAASLFSVLS